MEKILKFKHVLIILALLGIIASILVACAPERRPPRKGFVPKPCMECHKETQSEFQKKYVHAPMSERDSARWKVRRVRRRALKTPKR